MTRRVSQGAAESLSVTGKQVLLNIKGIFSCVSMVWSIVGLSVMPLQESVSDFLM